MLIELRLHLSGKSKPIFGVQKIQMSLLKTNSLSNFEPHRRNKRIPVQSKIIIWKRIKKCIRRLRAVEYIAQQPYSFICQALRLLQINGFSLFIRQLKFHCFWTKACLGNGYALSRSQFSLARFFNFTQAQYSPEARCFCQQYLYIYDENFVVCMRSHTAVIMEMPLVACIVDSLTHTWKCRQRQQRPSNVKPVGTERGIQCSHIARDCRVRIGWLCARMCSLLALRVWVANVNEYRKRLCAVCWLNIEFKRISWSALFMPLVF